MSTTELYNEMEQMVRGETKTYSREEFRQRCDEADRITYLGVARQIAAYVRCEIHVHEDTLEFVCPP